MKSVLVVGESCVDEFIYCEAERLAPDVPVPVLTIIDRIESHGMAANVHRNLRSLGVEAYSQNSSWDCIRKTRYVHHKTNHTFFRVDSGDRSHPANVGNLMAMSDHYDILVISDYDKGYLNEYDIYCLTINHPCTFVDTKKPLNHEWVEEATYIKINDFEYKQSAQWIDDRIKNKIIHTLGEDGCEFQGVHYPVHKVEVRDVSGAGDTFLAGLVAKYAETEDIELSIKFANQCASEVVKHRGVTSI